jgi:hypothetical protein
MSTILEPFRITLESHGAKYMVELKYSDVDASEAIRLFSGLMETSGYSKMNENLRRYVEEEINE